VATFDMHVDISVHIFKGLRRYLGLRMQLIQRILLQIMTGEFQFFSVNAVICDDTSYSDPFLKSIEPTNI
jgi:hypothetical protein